MVNVGEVERFENEKAVGVVDDGNLKLALFKLDDLSPGDCALPTEPLGSFTGKELYRGIVLVELLRFLDTTAPELRRFGALISSLRTLGKEAVKSVSEIDLPLVNRELGVL